MRQKFFALIVLMASVGCSKPGDAFNGNWKASDGSTMSINHDLVSIYNSKHVLTVASSQLQLVNNTEANFAISAGFLGNMPVQLVLIDNNSKIQMTAQNTSQTYARQ